MGALCCLSFLVGTYSERQWECLSLSCIAIEILNFSHGDSFTEWQSSNGGRRSFAQLERSAGPVDSCMGFSLSSRCFPSRRFFFFRRAFQGVLSLVNFDADV